MPKVRNCKIEVSGYTKSNTVVIQNIFGLVESRGIPLEVCIDILNQNNCVIDWNNFISQSIGVWSIETTYKRIEESVLECLSYDPKEKEMILNMIRFLILKRID